MARSPRKDTIAESIWCNTKAICPICKTPITHWYCPNCGVSKNNSGYIIYENELFHCGSTHFNKGVDIDEYKLCDKCLTPNPNNANYCRCCGENIATRAKDKYGHGWVDLGLSVLWSTESLSSTFLWNDNTPIDYDDYDKFSEVRELYIKSNCGESGGKDVATYYWGKKWRTPTKKEFEELITMCKWEKYIDPTTAQLALKVTGPNGNFIVFSLSSRYSICLWSSTPEDTRKAYFFHFHENVEFESTLTAKQKKRIEFEQSNAISFKVDLSTVGKWPPLSRMVSPLENERRKIFPHYEATLEKQRKILDAMGDDSQEIENNRKADLKRLHNLWLSTPIKISSNIDNGSAGTLRIRPIYKDMRAWIRPVAEKKW